MFHHKITYKRQYSVLHMDEGGVLCLCHDHGDGTWGQEAVAGGGMEEPFVQRCSYPAACSEVVRGVKLGRKVGDSCAVFACTRWL